MIVLFTDFGRSGPYLAQMQAVLIQQAPGIPVLDLMSNAPKFNPYASSLLLAAYGHSFPEGTVFLCVIDPGVGSERLPIVVKADGKFYVGPDNGLFEQVLKQSSTTMVWQITYSPTTISNTFHGRDIFAPVAAMIACGDKVPGNVICVEQLRSSRNENPNDKNQLIYIDHYGNCITGICAGELEHSKCLCINDHRISYARCFSEVEAGGLFWYENSSNLIEIAVNCGDAAENLGVRIGSRVIPC
ncbi:MAG: SAM-dependent chlorinase/fluorinase [Gammaproteobacteria bacterium]|nr:SAM-dependent chlorinase/fluorinase [Gammaproteobacteria bacterium]